MTVYQVYCEMSANWEQFVIPCFRWQQWHRKDCSRCSPRRNWMQSSKTYDPGISRHFFVMMSSSCSSYHAQLCWRCKEVFLLTTDGQREGRKWRLAQPRTMHRYKGKTTCLVDYLCLRGQMHGSHAGHKRRLGRKWNHKSAMKMLIRSTPKRQYLIG